ncbi:MarR family transcriptional regulator, partial [Cupriavidus sp. SIMBA_020]
MEGPFDDDCFAIRQAARHVSQLYDRHLANVGLTITQFSLLGRLKRAGPMTMKQLADTMRMQRTTLVRTIQPLRRNGLIASE